MNNNPLVSIIINNYNYDRFLAESIDSALTQTYSHIEVIVVDDGSTDNSREILASYQDKIIPILKENGGQASAFNTGFANSKGDIICFLDSDDVFFPEKVAQVVAALGDRQDLGWCFHPLKFVDVNLADINGNQSSEKNNDESLLQEYDLTTQLQKGKPSKTFPYPSTTGLSLKRFLLEKILPMPEKAEKTLLNDAFITFSSLGLSKGVVLNTELGFYRVHGSNANAMGKGKAYQLRTAKINILQGYWIGAKFPSLSKLANHLIATGVGIYERNGGMEDSYKELVKKHLSLVKPKDKISMYLRIAYNYIRNPKY
jgi:glycosyltransferase involved in cell wall biosynthesis